MRGKCWEYEENERGEKGVCGWFLCRRKKKLLSFSTQLHPSLNPLETLQYPLTGNTVREKVGGSDGAEGAKLSLKPHLLLLNLPLNLTFYS